MKMIIFLLWPLAALANTCADMVPTAGMTCHEYTLFDGQTTTIMVNNRLRVDGKYQETATTGVAPRATETPITTDQDNDMCGDTTWTNDSDPTWPPVADCNSIGQWARDNMVYWRAYKHDLAARSMTTLLVSGRCKFVIGCNRDDIPEYGIIVGNTDVADLVQDAIATKVKDDRVAALGTMNCWTTDTNGGVKTTFTKWGIIDVSIA
ncbi:uncharacterized protein BCR38DRAFT_482214 [Pseudomassariella vexata]|uniref:Ecp2 effector protein-like domain-containing protein n=1 Tax=Pseudomassariella vexata TaxID=1141098 RepID=A0A1Y2EAY6_9PEZI|nr:uncharacterized protein BCR38DRAFT_482214 [Pseudomassariella vexata]ORY68728.1 hypothetical protein BCR38DRAFT_482214 [Pseudomassariella vexata]